MNAKGRVAMRTVLKMTFFIFVLMLSSLIGLQPISAANIREAPELNPIWDKLDAARGYRDDWRGIGKTHSQLIVDYKNNPVSEYEPKTPQQLFTEAAQEFANFLEDIDLNEEATWGLQEALNEYMAGQLLIGNDLLIKGLRVRFPSTGDPGDPDHLTLLKWSADEFQEAINQTIEALRTKPESMRAGSNVIPQFPFYVENAVITDGTQGETVENELYRFTNLVERAALANNSKAKRMYFFDNVKDVDNFPYGNFPGSEDLDLNGNGIQDEAGRDAAASQFKHSAHATYLHTAVLASVQTEEEFDQNNGYQLKSQILDAQRLFDDILSGFNPLQLLGDFVPHQPVENFFNLARTVVVDAISAERAAKLATRQYDQDETTLRGTLQSQQLNYLNRIEALTGLTVQGNYNLLQIEDRERLFLDAQENIINGNGQMGLQILAIEEATIAARQSYKTLEQIPEKIRIEESRNNQTASLITNNGYQFSALSVAETMLSSVNVSFSQSTSFSVGPTGPSSSISFSKNVSINPLAPLLATVRGRRDILNAMQQSQIRGIDSAATIKQLLLEQAQAQIAVERAGKILEQENTRLDELWAEFQRTVRNYVADREDMSSAYFTNPAYRLDRDQLTEAAEITFESAMVESYYAAKALEYLWSEKFNNPVNRLDGGLPEPLAPTYDPYVRAESIFSVKFAEIKSPNLDQYLDALQAWDVKMRDGLRVPEGQNSSETVSIRKNVLGYDGMDEEYNRLLFKDFIAKHRVDGLNPDNPDLIFEFALEIGDEKLFPDHPNIKVEKILINLVSSPERSIAGSGTTSEPAKVDLIMLDEANVRTFFAEYPTDDDILTYDLEQGRNLEKSTFYATVDATIDGWSDPLPYDNIQLANHSPAVTRWTLRMKMNRGNNQYLRLEQIDDVEITIFYRFGKPWQVVFP
jgi:hypothetical protein